MTRIYAIRQDDRGRWQALLSCGHVQPIRHRPPYRNYAWVLSAEGREKRIGTRLRCRECNEQ